MRWLFVLAYASSGFAGLVYEVTWTRLLTLAIGHSTAAASAVVAAFLGGLAVGAAIGGRQAARLTRAGALKAYGALEAAVAVLALLLPWGLSLSTPLLSWAYADGTPNVVFPVVRVLVCLLLVFVPALALGATFPLAVRWFAADARDPASATGLLYAANTAGAALGATLAGLWLIPRIGMLATTGVGVAASLSAAIAAVVLLRSTVASASPPVRAERPAPSKRRHRARAADIPGLRHAAVAAWLPAAVLGVSGFAALMHEIAWTRILTLVLGPTIYAFAATLAVVIAGVAIGSWLGGVVAGRSRQPAVWLMGALAAAAVTAAYTATLAGHAVPRLVAESLARTAGDFDAFFQQGLRLTVALVMPTAVCLGAAFPLALAMLGRPEASGAGSRVSAAYARVYAVNTIGAVSGALAAGFLVIPALGLRTTLLLVTAGLVAAALLVGGAAVLSRVARAVGLVAVASAALVAVVSPPWDRELLASGLYLYTPFVPEDLDLVTQLEAGTLLYYREGSGATVSVKRLTGTTTLAVDGKVDASNRGDMLTQKLVAHLPLLLHERPQDVAIVGLGSGVTVGSALRHPIARADVLEISPEVVEASAFFVEENHRALDDPRTNLIVGDGRSHLLLSDRQYDVIISEPSNPWIAGVASLFTREFFLAARARLAPGGIICQWANAYNISEGDLRAIVRTFQEVFPNATAWLVGADDVILLASLEPLGARLRNIERHWTRAGVAEDLALVSAAEPFALWSLYVGGPAELTRFGAGAQVLTDDRMALEFSGPRQLHVRGAGENAAALTDAFTPEAAPDVVRTALASASADAWRRRGDMLARRDAHTLAYEDYVRALRLDPTNRDTLRGFVRAASLTGRGSDALAWIKALTGDGAPTAVVLTATSKLLATIAETRDAVAAAEQASRLEPIDPAALEQLASLHADAGDEARLDEAVARLRAVAPEAAVTQYYAAVSAFLRGDATDAVRLGRLAVAADPAFAPVHDLLGAAYTKLGQPQQAREAFERSLVFDPHDSTAYTNLGLLALAGGHHEEAANHFAEALWLTPTSVAAREGLAQAVGARDRRVIR